jgi:hypothetical protein
MSHFLSLMYLIYSSIYDVLCEIFFFRSFMTLLGNVINPFLHCSTPEEAKSMLDNMKDKNIAKSVHKLIFTKVKAIRHNYN